MGNIVLFCLRYQYVGRKMEMKCNLSLQYSVIERFVYTRPINISICGEIHFQINSTTFSLIFQMPYARTHLYGNYFNLVSVIIFSVGGVAAAVMLFREPVINFMFSHDYKTAWNLSYL